MMHNGNCDSTSTDNGTCVQVTCNVKPEEMEEMVTLQQQHNTNSVNGETMDCNTNEAQTLAEAMCDFNDTFASEENFIELWQKSHNIGDEDKETVMCFGKRKCTSNMQNNTHWRKDCTHAARVEKMQWQRKLCNCMMECVLNQLRLKT